MWQTLLSSKGFLAGLIICILLIAGSLVYQESVNRDIREDEARTRRFLQQLENKKETRTAQDAGGLTDSETLEPAEMLVASDDAQTMPEETEALPSDGAARIDTADVFFFSDTAEEEPTEVPVSPYGFGPYPEVPVGFPSSPFPAPSANHELMRRVWIKLLSQGINVVGTNMEDGLVYPVIKGTAYVKWKSYWRPTGKVTYISNVIAHPEDGARLNAIRFEKGKSLTKADVPPDIKLVSFEEAAINPYTFLNLPQGGKQ